MIRAEFSYGGVKLRPRSGSPVSGTCRRRAGAVITLSWSTATLDILVVYALWRGLSATSSCQWLFLTEVPPVDLFFLFCFSGPTTTAVHSHHSIMTKTPVERT